MRAKQNTEMATFLQQAQREAQARNWLEVNYYLQQLPIFAGDSSFSESEKDIQEQILQLALTVLMNGDFQQKWNIAKVFPGMGAYGIAPLISVLATKTVDTETKWFAARILGDFKEQRVVIALATLLQNTSESDLIAIASSSLAKIGLLAIETLLILLQKPEYRLIAAKSIAYIRLEPVLPALLELATDENPEIKVLAIEALGSFRSPQIPPVLIQALKDTYSMVRKEAVIAIGFCADLSRELDLASYLQPLLSDLNPDVCRQAAISLGKIRTESAIEALNGALQSPNISLNLKLDIVKALAWSEISLALDYLQAAITIENDLVRNEIITVLGRINANNLKTQAISILQDFWHSSPSVNHDFECKKALAIALGELQVISGKDILKQLAQDDNKMIKLYAIAGLKKLSPS